MNHLKEFIHYISSNNEANFNEIEDFSKGIFILSIVFGFTVDDAISFLYNENKNIKRLQNGRISVAIDSELFAKYRVNPLLQKRSFTINYVLQDYIHRLINELANHIFLFSNLAYYFKNMKDTINSYIDKKLKEKETVSEAIKELKTLLNKQYE